MEAVLGPRLSEAALIHAVLSGVREAWEELIRRHGDALREVMRPLALPSEEAERLLSSFLETLRKNAGDAFAGYKPETSLTRYLATLFVNHLAPRVLKEIEVEAGRGFTLFEQIFGDDLRCFVRRYFFGSPGDSEGKGPEDIYHDLLIHLMEGGGRRLLSFDGKGAFRVYLQKIVRNYWLDSIRHQRGRRRLPKAIQALPSLEQTAFQLMAWEGLSGHEAIDRLRLSVGRGEPLDRLEAAIDRIIPYIPPPAPRGVEAPPDSELPEPDPDVVSALLRWQRIRSPHSELLARIRQRELDAALERLREAIRELPDDQRSFLFHRYFADAPLTPREIARRWRRPVQEVYEVSRRAMAALRVKVQEAGIHGLEL